MKKASAIAEPTKAAASVDEEHRAEARDAGAAEGALHCAGLAHLRAGRRPGKRLRIVAAHLGRRDLTRELAEDRSPLVRRELRERILVCSLDVSGRRGTTGMFWISLECLLVVHGSSPGVGYSGDTCTP